MQSDDQTLTARQSRYLQRLSDARERLLNAIAGLDEKTLCSDHVVGDWTIKDMLGHIVSWNEEFRADIEMILHGKHPGYERLINGKDDFDEWNQNWASKKRDWSWQDICSDFDRDFQEASNLILRLQRQDFRKRGVTPWKRAAVEKPPHPSIADTESVETLVTFHWRHMNQHVRMIEKWRKRRNNSSV